MRYLIIFFYSVLFAINVYIPDNATYYKKFFKEFNIHFYKDVNKIDLNDSLAIVPYYFIPDILKNNYEILAPLEREKEYIISHNELRKIRSLANATFASKIFFSILDNNITFKNASLKDFLQKKVDAIVLNKKLEKYYIYNLKTFGLEFNKYYLIAFKKFISLNNDLIEKVVEEIEESKYFKPNLVYKSFTIAALYLNKKINFDKLLYENYIDDQYMGKTLKVIVTPNWPPFNFIQNNQLKGIGVDFWKLLAQKAGLDYKFVIKSTWMEVLKDIKSKKGDVTIATSETEDRKKFAIFTKSYMKFPLALVCKKDVKENDIYKLKIGVGKDFTAEKLMKKYYPKINLIEEKNTIEALKNVENSNLDCVVDILPTVVWLVNKENFLNLKLFKKLPIEFKLQIMIRKDLVKLRDRLNEAIDKITPEEKNKIINKYIGFIQEKDQNRILFTQIAVFVLVVFVIFLVYEYFKVKKIANYDKLTQIYNRNALSKYLKELLKSRGSIIFFDIDHFKKINDTYGHEKGDFVLKELAKIIKENLRKNDIFGRWGGEEFLILLPNTSYEETLKVAEKLRKIIEKHDFGGLNVTVSFGVTYVKKDDNENTLLERADKALYEAKNSGRNQIKGKL